MADEKETKKEVKKETKPVTRKKRERKNVPFAIAKVQATFNNTIITITEPNGNVVCWASAGASGFKGSKKSTPFAAQVAGDTVARRAMDQGVRAVDVEIRGPGAGREAAVRALQSAGLKVHIIKDTTPVPHNGCRPPKRRRV